jgi:hypothetical protein
MTTRFSLALALIAVSFLTLSNGASAAAPTIVLSGKNQPRLNDHLMTIYRKIPITMIDQKRQSVTGELELNLNALAPGITAQLKAELATGRLRVADVDLDISKLQLAYSPADSLMNLIDGPAANGEPTDFVRAMAGNSANLSTIQERFEQSELGRLAKQDKIPCARQLLAVAP